MTKQKDVFTLDCIKALFITQDESWNGKALCRGRPLGSHDTSGLPNSHLPSHRTEARRLCEGCPVIRDCAGYALRTKSIGVVMAGVPLKMAKNKQEYDELRQIAGVQE